MRDGSRVDVHDSLALVVDDQPVTLYDLADHGGSHAPLLTHGEELVHVLRPGHRHHAFLALAHQDLLRGETRIAKFHVVQGDVHAAVARAGQLGGGARDARRTQILDPVDEALGEQLQGALDDQLLHVGVTGLHAGAFAWAVVGEGARCEHRAAYAVAAGCGAVQDHLVADAGRVRALHVLVPQDAHAEGVHQRVSVVGGLEHRLTTDAGHTERVAVAGQAGHHPGQDTGGVGGVQRAEAELVGDPDRARPHGEDVPRDSADTRGRALVGLYVAGVVVGLDLEGDRPAVPDVDDTGLLADTGQQGATWGVLAEFAEPAQVNLARLVGTVLRPHDGVHRQLTAGGAPTQNLSDPEILVLSQAQIRPGLVLVGGVARILNGVDHALQPIFLRRTAIVVLRDSRGPFGGST